MGEGREHLGLEAAPHRRGAHRLIIRLRCRYRWTRPTIVTGLPLMEIGDFPMMRKLMLGIKRRAERGDVPLAEPAEARAG